MLALLSFGVLMSSKAKITLIAAMSRNGVIGRNGDLPWNTPELRPQVKGDLKLFKEHTKGHAIVMGRKTWESLPKKPLPGRQSWVLSRSKQFRDEVRAEYPGVQAMGSHDCLFETVRAPTGHWYVIGGAQIYEAVMPHADFIELTIIPMKFTDGDLVYFPRIDDQEWALDHTCVHPYNPSLKCARYKRIL